MTAYRLAWQMRYTADGTRISFRRALRFARSGLAAAALLEVPS